MFKRATITEMGHVEALAGRILFLKGSVEMVPAAPVEKIAGFDRQLENIQRFGPTFLALQSFEKAQASGDPRINRGGHRWMV